MGRKRKFSDAPQMMGPKFGKPSKSADAPGKGGDWYVVLKQLECNGKAYLPLNHHLVVENSVPDRVPSNGAKGEQAGKSSVPVDISGMINLADLKPEQVYRLCRCRTVAPVDPEKSKSILVLGEKMSRTMVPAMVPPVRRVNGLKGQYEQATSISMTADGMRNFNFAQAALPSPFGR